MNKWSDTYQELIDKCVKDICNLINNSEDKNWVYSEDIYPIIDEFTSKIHTITCKRMIDYD